jgi:thermostable 8-oxoguanine DNA glycosylase
MLYKIDPDNVTKFDATFEELELQILFWICAAGKNGHTSARCLNDFLSYFCKKNNKISPFEIIASVDNLPFELKRFGIGCYNNKAKTISELLGRKLNLKTCSLEQLENIWGMGPKTARCFLIHSRRYQKLAGLDRHILRFLKDNGYEVPKNSPNKKQYAELEKIFLGIAEKTNKTISELDLEIWKNKRLLPKNLEKIS